MNLIQSPVVFDKESHTYTYNGRQLSGVTSMLSRQLFSDKYSGVSENVLRRAAERGSRIHSLCELADRTGIADTPEADDYLSLCHGYGLKYVESEYLVSDLTNYASCIDKVYAGSADNKYWLGDIKTTYSLDKEYLSWQLSVYAYLFELQNPGCEVERLFGIWLRPEHKEITDVSRIDSSVIKELLTKDAAGEKFINNLPSISDGEPLPEKYKAVEDTLISMQLQYDYLKKQLDKFKEECLALMDKGGVKKFSSDRLSITRRADSTRESFDTAKFKKEHPDMYKAYIKTSQTKGGITMKIL